MGYSDSTLAILAARELGASRGLGHFLARTPSQREAIYRLRYEAYHDVGHVGESREASLSDEYDFEPGSCIYGVTMGGHLVSTIRLGVLSSDDKASITYEVFKDYLDPIIEGGERIAHGSRLAVRCADSALRRCIVLYTLSLTAAFATSERAGRGAIIVRDSHVPFYQRCGFNLVSGPRNYHETSTPLSLMMINLESSWRQTPVPAQRFVPAGLHSGGVQGNML